jgi:hypothetical protein
MAVHTVRSPTDSYYSDVERVGFAIVMIVATLGSLPRASSTQLTVPRTGRSEAVHARDALRVGVGAGLTIDTAVALYEK